MPTAIVKIPTREGILFASDGRARDEQGQIVSENEQKIYQIGTLPMACGFSGPAVKILNPQTRAVIFNFVDEFRVASEKHPWKPCDTPVPYFQKLSDSVHARFIEIQLLNEMGTFQANERLCYVIGCGYFEEASFGFRIEFSYTNGTFSAPQVKVRPTVDLVGSDSVAYYLRDEAREKLVSFREPYMLPEIEVEDYSLNEAIGFAKAYIRACDSDEGRTIDPKDCPGIGGRIQVATLKPDYGFQWVLGCEPLGVGKE